MQNQKATLKRGDIMNTTFTQEQKDRLIRDRDDTKRSLEALVIQLAAAQSEKEILEAFGSLKFQGDQAQMLLNEYQVRVG